jgi:2-keto-4-pentenoate hydratase/2-oxohepta-3-ene-1,7-dioic acid hydratase in catechol pathway
MRTTVDSRDRQNDPLADMFLPPLELVARLSHDVTLEPGDVSSAARRSACCR